MELFCVSDTVSSSSGVYSGAGSEGSNSPDSHHVARLLVTQQSDIVPTRRPSRDHHHQLAATANGKDQGGGGGRTELLLAKATAAGVGSTNGDAGGSGRDVSGAVNGESTAAGTGQFPKCGRRMVERANSRVANLSGLVRLPFARLPSQQHQQLSAVPAAAGGSSSNTRQLREF